MITIHPSQKKKEYSNINKQKKKKNVKAKWHPLQYSAGFFVLEGIVWSGDSHKEGVVSVVFIAVVHKVRGGLGYLQKQWKTKTQGEDSVAMFTQSDSEQGLYLSNF